MKYSSFCDKCTNDFKKQLSDEEKAKYFSVPEHAVTHFVVNDQNYYQITCSEGHKYGVAFAEAKFELLYNSGVSAYSEGYNRECVSSVAASIERFYEFLIQAFLFRLNVPRGLVDETWKLVKRQSERQLGAYTFLYASITGKKPELITTKMVEFRNDVIHNGVFPTEEQTVLYMKYVIKYFYNVIDEIKKTDAVLLGTYYKLFTEELRVKYKDASVCEYKSFGSRYILWGQENTFEDVLQEFIINNRVNQKTGNL